MFLHPWIGSGYSTGINGEKILILGETHYDEEPFGDQDGDSDYTQKVVSKILHSKEQIRFFKVIGELFYDDWTTIWNQVAFANLIQFVIEKGSQPTPCQISTVTAFYKYLNILKPDKAIVCSSRAWFIWFKKYIDNTDGVKRDESFRLGKSFVFEYPYEGGKTKVIGINHSSSREADYNSTWKPVIAEFLKYVK